MPTYSASLPLPPDKFPPNTLSALIHKISNVSQPCHEKRSRKQPIPHRNACPHSIPNKYIITSSREKSSRMPPPLLVYRTMHTHVLFVLQPYAELPALALALAPGAPPSAATLAATSFHHDP